MLISPYYFDKNLIYCNINVFSSIYYSEYFNTSARPRGASGQTLASLRWGPGFTSRSLHVGFVVDETGSGQVFAGFLPFSPTTNFIPPFLILISSISFHFISPCDGASGVVGRHPCHSLTYNIGLHRISSLDPTLCWTRVEDILF